MLKSAILIRQVALAGIVAAMYIGLVLLPPLTPIAYGFFQIRFAEALTILPFLFPSAIPGLFLGCFLANLFSPLGPLDWVIGSLATFSAAILTAKCKNRFVAALPPVLINAVAIGAMLHVLIPEAGYAIGVSMLSVGIGQIIACYGLGVPLIYALEKTGIHKKLSFNQGR